MGLMLSGEFAQAAGVPSAPVAGFEMRGVLGRVESEMGMANRLDVGPFAFFEVATAVAPNGFFNMGFSGDSIVGFDLLAQFLVRIDYPRARVWLRRDPDARFAFDARDPDTFVDLEWPLPPEPPDALVAQAPRAAPEPQQVWLEWGAPQPGERVVGPVMEIARGVRVHGELVPLGTRVVIADLIELVPGPALLPLGLDGLVVVA